MANVCFTWELGQGFGHLVRYRAIVAALADNGHTVTFVTKDAKRVRTVFPSDDVRSIEIPAPPRATGRPPFTLNSYADILLRCGFRDPDTLTTQLEPWLAAIARIEPAVLIADHSPTVLLANRILQRPVISAGSGFTVPPRSRPMQPFRYWTMRYREGLAEREAAVLGACNAVLQGAGHASLNGLDELLWCDREWLLTFPEFDHYGSRPRTENYLGTFPQSGFGVEPVWPTDAGPRIFVYLSTNSLPIELTAALQELRANVCVYAPNLAQQAAQSLFAMNVACLPEPADLGRVAAQADLAVTNGGLNTVAGLARLGLPQLALPNNLERRLVARRLELMGGGLSAALRRPVKLGEKIHALLYEPTYRRALSQFAVSTSRFSPDRQMARMQQDLDDLLTREAL